MVRSPSSSESAPSTSYSPVERKLHRRGRSKSGTFKGSDGKHERKASIAEGRGQPTAAVNMKSTCPTVESRDEAPDKFTSETQCRTMDEATPYWNRRSIETHLFRTITGWLLPYLSTIYWRHKPNLDACFAPVVWWCRKFQSYALPFVRACLVIVGGIALTLGIMWLDCTIGGIRSLFRLGSGAVFLLMCTTVMNFVILAGLLKLFIALVLSFAAAFFFGYLSAFAAFGIFSGGILWMYGSFWITGGIACIGGFLLIADKPRLAILVGLLYSTYSTKKYGGWFGLFVCINIAFISNNLMVYVVRSSGANLNKHGRTESDQDCTTQDGGSADASSSGSTVDGLSANVEESRAVDKEVERVLSCRDHYAVLGLARYGEVDEQVLKRDYKKKAMLVHPDKNLGNTVAEEAFKRLQNAYEVLLDPSKKRCYDDELKREEVFVVLKRFQEEVLQNGRFGKFERRHSHMDGEGDAGSWRIVCKKCGNTHLWKSTDRDKLHARWCQECQDHHLAKDGDGWVEQLGHTFFFGMFRKVDVAQAYACADSKIYEVTEWATCQGMKCPSNTHRPSFHVSTAGIVKGGQSRGGRSINGNANANASDDFSFARLNENMTEEEFIQWLENAMASGMFNNDTSDVPGQQGKGESHAKPSRKKRKGKSKW